VGLGSSTKSAVAATTRRGRHAETPRKSCSSRNAGPRAFMSASKIGVRRTSAAEHKTPQLRERNANRAGFAVPRHGSRRDLFLRFDSGAGRNLGGRRWRGNTFHSPALGTAATVPLAPQTGREVERGSRRTSQGERRERPFLERRLTCCLSACRHAPTKSRSVREVARVRAGLSLLACEFHISARESKHAAVGRANSGGGQVASRCCRRCSTRHWPDLSPKEEQDFFARLAPNITVEPGRLAIFWPLVARGISLSAKLPFGGTTSFRCESGRTKLRLQFCAYERA